MHHNHLCQALNDGTFTYARLADENGVVFLTSSQDFHHTLYFPITTNAGIEFPLGGTLRQVCAEVVKYRCFRLDFLLLSGGLGAVARRSVVGGSS